MARQQNDWDRNRDYPQNRDRDNEQRGEYGQRSSDYGSHAGWGGQGFSQGSFGSYGGQGEHLYNQYGGQGAGFENGQHSGYRSGSREFGGGMSTWTAGSQPRDRYANDRSDERRREDFDRDRNMNRDREQWAQPGAGNFSGWGGYGGYDRERSGEGRYQNYNQGNYGQGNQWRDENRGFRSSDPWSSPNNMGQYPGSPYGSGQFGNTGSSNMDYQGGSHAGRGPKGYRRSDDRIKEDVNEHLTRHHEVDASDVEVDVQNGEVTLKGTVDNRQAKRTAEDIVERVSGVRQVHNQIRVENANDRSSLLNNLGQSGSGSTTTSGVGASSQQRETAGARK